MRFLYLNLVAYGPFTEVSLDLSAGNQGLHIIFGPNEAGKSAALRAMHAVLFGISGQTTDNFTHEYARLRIGARLQNSGGDELSFVRRKGRSATLLKTDDDQGSAYPDSVLDPYLASTDGETFGRVYGIGYEELRRGGMELKAMRGLVGESLFVAGLGIACLSNTLATLDQEAHELYTTRSATSTIRKYITEYKQVQQDKRKAEVPTSRWEGLQLSIKKSCSHRDDLATKLKNLRIETGRLDRLRRALPRVVEREQLGAELDELGEVVILPSSYSTEERISCQNNLKHAGQRVPRLREDLDGEHGLRNKISALSIPEGLLEQADLIAKLHEDLGSHLKASKDQADLRLKCDNLRAQAKARLAELRSDVSWDSVDSLRIAPDRKVTIQNLGNLEKTVRERPTQIERNEVNVISELKADRIQVNKLDSPRDSAQFKGVLSRIQKDGDLDQQLVNAKCAMDGALADAEKAHEALGLWKGSLVELERLIVPLKETVNLYENNFSEVNKQREKHDGQECTARDEAGNAVKKIEALQRAGDVPTEEQLYDVRKTRENGWGLVRADWLEGGANGEAVRDFAGEKPLAEAYEDNVHRSDEVADRLRREASRVAELAQQESNKAHSVEQLRILTQERESLEVRYVSLSDEWREQWSSTGIENPLSPTEMRAWLDRCNEAKRLAERAREAQQDFENLRQRIEANRDALGKCLAAVNEAALAPDELLSSNLDQCIAVIERIESTTQRRAELENAIVNGEATMRGGAADLEQAASELLAWEKKWATHMMLLGCPADVTADDANARIALIEDLFRNVDEADRENMRIEAIEAEANRFTREVQSLVERVAPDLIDLPAAQAAAELTSRLDEAKTANVKLDHLQKEETAKQEELDDLEETIREKSEELALMCHLAQVDTHDMLEVAEKISAEVTRVRSRLKKIDEELTELGEGMTIDELVIAAQGQNADDLAAQISSIDDELVDLGKRRDEFIGEIRELENERNTIDGSSDAAEADEGGLGILAAMNEAAGRYIRLRLAAVVLRQRIEVHRTKAQDPLLSRASELFAKLTCGSFSGLKTDYDDNDQPVIVGARANSDSLLGVEAMSDGTQDQLYLALRLAYLEKLIEREEPMPFIVDDILVKFDDDRAQATLRVLGDLSRRTQVVFFTHHRHLVDIARDTLPTDDFFVHDLVSSDQTVKSEVKEH